MYPGRSPLSSILPLNRDSSIWQTTPAPPRMIGVPRRVVEHTSLSHLYTIQAVFLSTSASSAASLAGYCLAHQYVNMSHSCKVILDFEKKLSFRMVFVFLQEGQYQQMPSLMSPLFLSLMALPQGQVQLEARRPLRRIQAMIAGVPPQITGPTTLFRAILGH